jgi:hypothetical protein
MLHDQRSERDRLSKNDGTIQPPAGLKANPFEVSASALVLEIHAPTTKLDWRPIVQIEPAKAQAQPPGGTWPWIGLATELANPVLNEYLQELLTNIPIAYSAVELKQFRDASSLTDACYQAMVATRFVPSNIGVPEPLPAATVTVNQYASLDIPEVWDSPPMRRCNRCCSTP